MTNIAHKNPCKKDILSTTKLSIDALDFQLKELLKKYNSRKFSKKENDQFLDILLNYKEIKNNIDKILKKLDLEYSKNLLFTEYKIIEKLTELENIIKVINTIVL